MKNSKPFSLAIIGILTVLGFYLRLRYLNRMIFDVDEFNSLLGIKMILERGLPLLPSGLFYDRGLLFSYLGAGVARFAGFQAENIRWVSLFLSTLTIPTMYGISLKLFRSKLTGLLVSLAITIHPLVITWGGRARMYSQTQLLVFIVIFLVWQSLASEKRSGRYLILALLFLIASLLSHFVVSVTLPPLLLAIIVVYLLAHYAPNTNHISGPRAIWLISGLMLVGILAFGASQFSFQAQLEQIKALQSSPDGSSTQSTVLAITDLAWNTERWQEGWSYITHQDNILFSALASIGLGLLLINLIRRKAKPLDYTGLFLYVILVGILFEIYVILSDETHSPRHNFIAILPILVLLFGYGVSRVLNLVQNHTTSKVWASSVFTLIAGLTLWGFGPRATALILKEQRQTYRYDKGFTYTSERMVDDDQVMSYHSAAGYLYSEHFDYYTNQAVTSAIFNHPAIGQTVDVYTGSPYIGSVETLQTALEEPGRLWFVIDEKRLYNRYEPEFTQQVLHQMTIDHKIDNIIILAEKPDRWPLASLPEHPLQANFSGQMNLVGYTTQQIGQISLLTLFWQVINANFDYKIFVHLRDETGRIVTQADFWPYNEAIKTREWGKHWNGPTLVRTGTVLQIPEGLVSGQYNLFVGLYLPHTLERVPITGDTSGENAVVFENVTLN